MPITKDILRKYPNEIFIETGSHLGDGIRAALGAGFNEIYSIEINEDKFKNLSKVFEKVSSVVLLCGDSSKRLKEVLDEIDQPTTIWLDAHIDDSSYDKKTIVLDDRNPILNELQIISKHHIKTHTILIDDLRLFNRRQGFWGLSSKTIEEYLLRINDKYVISFEDGYTKKDILVAKLEEI